MRHVQIKRLWWGLTATFAVAAVLFALRAPGVAAEDGQALFEAQCADCHTVAHVERWAEAHPDEAERRAWLDEVLQRHFAPAEDERPLIVDYIESMIAD